MTLLTSLYIRDLYEEERYILARPYKRSDVQKSDYVYGYLPVTIQLRAANPFLYSTETFTGHSPDGNSFKILLRNNGSANAYPTILMQHTDVIVNRPGVDRASITIANWGPLDITPRSYTDEKLDDRLGAVSYFRLQDLNQPNPWGIFNVGAGQNDFSARSKIDTGNNNIPASIAYSTWDDRSDADSIVIKTNREILASCAVYECDMEALARGKDKIVIGRVGWRAFMNSSGTRPNATFLDSSGDINYTEVTPVNEYGKGQTPREPFFLAPGDNYVYISGGEGGHSRVKFTWRNTYL